MSENQRFLGAAFAMTSGTAILIWVTSLSGNGNSANPEKTPVTPRTSWVKPATNLAKPVVDVKSEPVATNQSSERYYRDRHGAIVSESDVEEKLATIRSNISFMPDNGMKAYREGQLRFLEEEWARTKQSGPVAPLRAVHSSDSEVLIGQAPLPESQRKRIFYELVKAQDSGVGDREAYTLLSKRYGLSELMLNEIAYEGAAKKWPMP